MNTGVRPQSQRDQVAALVRAGLNDCEIARRTAIPRRTVNNWRRHGNRPRAPKHPLHWRPTDSAAYSYLLGLYLGDGHVAVVRGSSFLRITLDAKYSAMIAEASSAVRRLMQQTNVHVYPNPVHRSVVVQASHPLWPVVFPQHGPGKKHRRLIELTDWQREHTHRHPTRLLRGLLHSDGSRCINRFRTTLPSGRVAEYSYVRYFFTNYSADIRRIFCEHCELLGIRWTQSSFKNISIAHRDSIVLLDSFVGPKK